MAPKTGSAVPDAWDDDDWEIQADRAAAEDAAAAAVAAAVTEGRQSTAPAPKLTKAQRLARHAEENRKIWESADAPEPFHFLEVQQNPAPVATVPYAKQVKVLSRSPVPVIAKRPAGPDRRDVGGGAAENLVLGGGEDEDDDEDDESKTTEPARTPQEIRQRHMEKMRKYEEARARIFGEPSGGSGGGASSAMQPARSDSQTPPGSRPGQDEQNRGQRGRGKGRGRQKQPQPGPDRRDPAPRESSPSRELYDPNYAPRPAVMVQRREESVSAQQQPIRAPRGPGPGRGFTAARAATPVAPAAAVAEKEAGGD